MDVFISHSSADKRLADTVCAALEGAGLTCWIAPRNITPGADWSAEIIDGIEQSRLFVLVFTTQANRSPQVLREVERAVAKGLPILPFRAENLQPTKSLEFFISSQHWLDAFTPPLEQHLTKLNQTAKVLLDQPPVQRPDLPVRAARLPGGRRPVWQLALVGGLLLAALTTAVLLYRSRPSPHASGANATGQGATPTTPPADQSTPAAASPQHDPVYERILRNRYSLANVDQDGGLSQAELRRLLAPLRGTPAGPTRVFEVLDSNADEIIDPAELLGFAAGLVRIRDQDRDGQLSHSEFIAGSRELDKHVSISATEKVFRRRDVNRDGQVTIRETEQSLAVEWLSPN